MSHTASPTKTFAEAHRLSTTDLSRLLGGRRWGTMKSWVNGQTGPSLAEAIDLVKALRAKGVSAQLNDFDPEQKAAA